jgi:uncharacterized Zn finger protein
MRRARPPIPAGWGARWAALVAQSLRALSHPPKASNARVRDLEIGPHGATARVRDAHGRSSDPMVVLDPFPRDAKERIVDALAKKATFAASLLAGRLPEEIDEVLRAAAGRPLLPASAAEIHQSCTCGEPVPCRHLLALHEVLGERLSRDPFLLFTLRGIDQESLLGGLRKRRGPAASAERAREPVARTPASTARLTPLPEVPPERFFRPLAPLAPAPYSSPTPPDAALSALGPPPLEDADAARLLAELPRAIGLGAKERLSEWEWRRS